MRWRTSGCASGGVALVPKLLYVPALRSPLVGATNPVWLSLLVAFIAAGAGVGASLGSQLVQRRTAREQLGAGRARDRELWRPHDETKS